ncbi:MAG: HEAT repeat domain-containing protein, partial [Asgard group archaeon]|nr:HEAT repeat domain-containing protein [Asgard group archaeon]
EELLDDLEHPLIRSNTALAIGGISKRLDDNTLTDTLEQHLKTETNEDVKEAIVYALSDIADESSLDIFHEYIKLDHNEVLRFHIAKALTEIASEKSAKVLFDIIKGKNTETLKLQCERALNEISEKNDVSRDKLEKKYG